MRVGGGSFLCDFHLFSNFFVQLSCILFCRHFLWLKFCRAIKKPLPIYTSKDMKKTYFTPTAEAVKLDNPLMAISTSPGGGDGGGGNDDGGSGGGFEGEWDEDI